jgi:hypothetical protein
MSLLVFAGIAFGACLLAMVLRSRAAIVPVVGLLGLAGCVLGAIAIEPGQVLVIGGSGLATTPYLRLFLVLGSLAGLGLAVAGMAGGTRRDAPAVTLAILGACGLTMGLVDPRAAVLVATAGGLCGVLVTILPRAARAGATVGIREARAVIVAGALAIAATAWIGRDLSELVALPVVYGLAYLAMAVALAMRFGAIPFHHWAARLADVVPETSLPTLMALAPASLAVVALAWVGAAVAPLPLDLGPERTVIAAIAIISIVLAAIAAFVQDDIEHILGYSIVGDAGVVVLALATLEPAGWQAARLWILAFIVTRGAFAAWAAGIRAGLWTGRVPDLRGWAWRSPILAIAFVVIAVASVGFPGLAAYDARRTIIDLALPAPLAMVVLVGALAPVAYYARLFLIGLARPDQALAPVDAWLPRIPPADPKGIRRRVTTGWDVNRPFTTAVIAAALAVLSLATAAGAFDGPVAAAGPPPVVIQPELGPLPSLEAPEPSGLLPT